MKELQMIYNRFPRRFFTTYAFNINSFDEMMNAISCNIDKTHCGSSIYNYTGNPNDVVVDRIAFDLDGEDCYEQTRLLHEYLFDQDIKHFLVFSGRHFHVYAKVCGTPVNKRGCLININNMIEKATGIKNDKNVVGNLAKNLAIPYTFNFKSHRYVRPLTSKEFYMGHDAIKDMAKKNGGTLEIVGKDEFSAAEYDGPAPDVVEMEVADIDIGDDEELIKFVPANLKQYFQSELGHFERLKFITGLADFGFSEQQICVILKKILSPSKFYHCVAYERQVKYVMMRHNRIEVVDGVMV